jgi:peptide/nickel transport system ATP-binding protein
VSVLEINGLNISFHSAQGVVEVVKDLSLSLKKGTVFGLAGESGCGKSLTALAVMGILPPGMQATGEVAYGGRNLLGLKDAELRRIRGCEISMIFQEPMTSLNPVLRVGYQIEEVIRTHLKVGRKEAEKIARGILRAVHIPSPEVRMREYPHQMSGGMRQRVMMAMAIACSPAVLIADEPTTALDVTIQAQLLRMLRELVDEKHMALLLITHDLGIIAENAETVAVMYAGRLVETAPSAMLFERPAHPYTVGLLRSLPSARGVELRPIPGTVPRPGHLPPGCTFSDRCPCVVDACHDREPELLEVRPEQRARCIRSEEILRGDARVHVPMQELR